MAMNIRKCDCGNFTVNADNLCEECRDEMPSVDFLARKRNVLRIRAFRQEMELLDA